MNKLIIKYLSKTRTGTYILAIKSLIKEYLKDSGWNLSVRKKLPVDSRNNEIPWLTYSAIHFLTGRIREHFSIFEYGSGHSTIWFSKKASGVVSIEHDLKWFNSMKGKFSDYPNITYKYHSIETDGYVNEILQYTDEFDIIIIDGRERVKCALNSLKALKKDGVIIWDNSDRETYNEGYEFLINNGFKRLDFWGLGPIMTFEWCTSVFYREDNCLDI
jgi:predicted O-methyltransferase YrrM